MEIEQIANTLKELTKEIEKLKNQPEKVEETTVEQEQKIKNIAKAYPIKGHILTKSQEIVRNDYIAALLSVFAEDGDEKLRTQRKILIYRIIASFDKEIEASEYTAKSMKIDAKFWDRFMEEMSFEEKNCFLVDAILLGMYDVSSKREKYKIVSEVLQISGVGQKFIKNGAKIACAIMQQNFEKFTQTINENLNFNYFLGYFEKNEFTEIVTNIEELQHKTGRLLVANVTISGDKEIDFGKSDSKSIYFKNCKFVSVRSIKSYIKQIRFENCVFEKNTIHSSESFDIWRGIHIEYEENYTFITGENFRFYNTKFIGCKASRNLLNLTKSRIIECSFLNCKGRDLPCSNFIELNESCVEKCKFENCEMKTDKQNRNTTEGSLISVQFGVINNSSFNNCEVYGDSSYGSYARYEMAVVKAVESNIENNKFKLCRCKSYDSSNRTVKSYIVEFSSSIEKNNEFEQCESYHYKFSDRLKSHNVGKLD